LQEAEAKTKIWPIEKYFVTSGSGIWFSAKLIQLQDLQIPGNRQLPKFEN